MSKVRYFLGIFTAIAVFVFFLFIDFAEGIEKIAFSYLVAAAAAELVWWDSFVVRIPFFLLKFTGTVFLFWFGILFSNLIFFFIAIAIAAPIFGFIGSLIAASVTALLGLSMVMFPIHLIIRAGDLY